MAHKNTKNTSSFKPKRNQPKPNAAAVFRGPRGPGHVIHTQQEANDRLYDIFFNHDMSEISHKAREQFAHFYELLVKEQEHNNFTRLLKFRDIAIKHFIDCAIVPQHVELRFPLLDVGTGPGFPGIPLKILYPDKKILLAEGVQKRVVFLKKVREELKLENLEIIGRNIQRDFVYPVQGVITRAVEEMANTVGNVQNCLQVGGKIYFMKGPNVDIEFPQFERQWSEWFAIDGDYAYSLPKTSNERRLVVVRKIKEIPLPEDI